MKWTREMFIPKDATKMDFPGGVAYLSVHNGNPCAMVFVGRAQKPTENYRFSTFEKRCEYVTAFFRNLEASEKQNAARREEREAQRKADLESVQVGEIFYNSWGYDQTNIDFYQVTRKQGCRFWVRPIASSCKDAGFMCGEVVALPGQFISSTRADSRLGEDDEIEKRNFSMRHGCLSKWDGKPKYCSWYA